MSAVKHLLTFVDLRDADDAGTMSVSARHEAVLVDGRRVVLLDDRGWTEGLRVAGGEQPPGRPRGIWAYETVEGIERTAREVVGPDEPFGDRTQADMAASHWDRLALVLRRAGVEVDAPELRGLPHRVELSDRVRARIGRAG